MTGVIIAAGRGERLSSISGGKPKTLIEINGKAIIQWIIDDLRSAGVGEIYLVVGFAHESIETYIREKKMPSVHFIYNDRWERGNGISVLSVSGHLPDDGPFLLTMSDHLIGKGGIQALMEMERKLPLLLVERDLDHVFDLEDATKVMIDGGLITDIGKEIGDYNGVDAGAFILDGRIFPFLESSIEEGKESLTAGIKAMLAEHTLTACTIPDGLYWIDVDSEDAFKNARKMWRCT